MTGLRRPEPRLMRRTFAAVLKSQPGVFMRRFSFVSAIVLFAGWTLSAQVVTSGGVVTPNYSTGPTTPVITLGTTSPSPVGASNATPGNQAGATNSTLQPSVPSGLAPQTVYTTPVIENLPQSAGSSMTAANTVTPMGRNLPAALYDSAWSVAGDTGNVAEAARKARMAKAGRKPRIYTNADIARLRGQAPANGTGDVNASSGNTPVANEQTMPASDVGAENAPQAAPVTPSTPPAQGQQQKKSPFGVKPPPQPR